MPVVKATVPQTYMDELERIAKDGDRSVSSTAKLAIRNFINEERRRQGERAVERLARETRLL
jgi:rRNA-processing protein FCF1